MKAAILCNGIIWTINLKALFTTSVNKKSI